MSPPRRPLILAIDVEPDGRVELDRDNGWKGSADSIDELKRFRGALETATNADVKFNWFLRADPQIAGTWGTADYVAEACPGLVRTIESAGDQVGSHVHAWRWSEDRQTWFNDLLNAAWMSECVDSSMKAIAGITGSRVVMNRFGDRWMSVDAVALLRASGIKYDLTMEPGVPDMPIHDDDQSTSWLPDMRGAPRVPYVPDGNDFLTASAAPGDDDLLMIPLTTSTGGLRLVRRPPFIVWGSRTANLALDHAQVWKIISDALNKPSSAPVTIVLRSGDLSNPRFKENFSRTARTLVRHPALGFCELTTVEEAAARWRKAQH